MTDPETTTTRSSGGGWLLVLIIIAGLGFAAFAFGLIKIDQTQEARAPVFDVSTARIDLGKRQATVRVPTVDVGTTDTQVTVPTVSIEPAKDPK